MARGEFETVFLFFDFDLIQSQSVNNVVFLDV